MNGKEQKNKKHDISIEIQDFTYDAYNYIWSKQKFFKQGETENYLKGKSLTCSALDETKNILKFKYRSKHFKKSIGKAIKVSQFLLRDYFLEFFKFLTPEKNDYKKEVKLLWSQWVNNRNDIFVKVTETLAIIAEAFLFSDCYLSLKLELNEMSEWFIEWFEEKLAEDFYKCGGWEKLEPPSDSWYVSMFYFMQDMIYKSYNPNHTDNIKDIYTRATINELRNCGLKFPVPECVLCNDNQQPGDEHFYQRTVYVRLVNENQEGIILTKTFSSSVSLPDKIRGTFKCDLSKDEKNSSKSILEELITTEKCSTILKQANYFPIQKNFKGSVKRNFQDSNAADIRTSPPANRSLSIKYFTNNTIDSRGNNSQREQKEFLNNIVECSREKAFTDDIHAVRKLQKDVYNEKFTDEKKFSSTNFYGKLHSSIPSASSENKYIKGFSPDRNTIQITHSLSESRKIKHLTGGTFTTFSPVASNNLEQTLAFKESLPTKSVFKTVAPVLESSNKQDCIKEFFSLGNDVHINHCQAEPPKVKRLNDGTFTTNNIVERPLEKSSFDNIQTKNILQKDVYNYKYTDTRIPHDVYNYKYTDTSTNFDGEIHSSIASSSSEKNYVKEFSVERNDVPITRFQAESPNVIRLNDGTFTKFSPVPTNNLEQTVTYKESLPTKSVLETVHPVIGSSYKQDSKKLQISFHKSDSFKNCMQQLQQAAISKDCEFNEQSNRFYLISDKYCNSFETMFKAYLYNFSEENAKNVNISEVPTKTSKGITYQNDINGSNDLFSLKFIICEYRYYFIGEE